MRDPIVIDVTRNGVVESVHHGRAVVTLPDRSLAFAVGDVTAPMYPRSATKPMQAIAMLRAGLDLDGQLLALAAASHRGEPMHVEGAQEILDGAGLDESALQCPPDLPLDETARTAWLRAGRGPEPLAMNCSGKHAAMLRTCVRAGWSTETYRQRHHPLHGAVAEVMTDLAGEPVDFAGVDGCGAPAFTVSLVGLARTFGTIAAAPDGHARAVADAYRAFPAYTSGTASGEKALIEAIPGLVCKGGAEAVLAMGLPDGTGIALKIMDGNPRGTIAWGVTLLRALGHDALTLDALVAPAVLGHAEPVGSIAVRPAAHP